MNKDMNRKYMFKISANNFITLCFTFLVKAYFWGNKLKLNHL